MNGRHLFSVALIAISAGTPVAADWPQYRGPASRGSLDHGLPEGEGELVLEQRWIRELGSGYSGLAIEGEVIVATFAAGEQDVVAAFARASGEELWRTDLEATYAGHDGSHDGPIATPSIVGGRVFALGAGGRLAAFELATGQELWAVHLVEDLDAAKPWYGFGSSPLAVSGRVVVGAAGGEAGTLIALDQQTGEVSWRTGTDSINYQSAILADFGGGEQVVIGGMSTVFAVEPESGELLWSYEHGGGGGRGAASLTVLPVANNRIFIDHDDRLSALLEIRTTDGAWSAEKIWEGKALINSYIPPVAKDGALFGYSTRFLTAVDEATGEILFRSREPGDGFPLIIEDQMVILTKAGTLHLGPASSDGWNETGSLPLFDGHSWTAPAYVDGSLYLRSFGQLARVDLARGPGESGTAASTLPPRIAEIVGSDDPAATVDRLWTESKPPWIDGDRVTFVWRGEAEDVGVGGDMIGVRAEEAMERIPGTDLWWFAATVPPTSRFNYAYLVDYGPAVLDPSNPRSVESTIYGPDMNMARPDSTVMSWLGMPGWVEPDHYAEPPAERPRGRVDELEVTYQPPAPDDESEAPEPVEIGIAVWTPPGYDDGDQTYDVAYVADGKARTLGGWVNTLDRLVGERFTPAVVVFVDMPRMGPPDQSRAFLEKVLPKVESDYRVGSDRDSRALVGAGGSSLNVLTFAFSEPGFARRIAAQSFHGIEATMTPLKAAMEAAEADKPSFDIYLEWGALDLRAVKEGWDMREAARDIHRELTSRGYRVTGGEVNDSTDWASWRNRTDIVLETLFPLAEAGTATGASSSR